jgi:hypothetical protein
MKRTPKMMAAMIATPCQSNPAARTARVERSHVPERPPVHLPAVHPSEPAMIDETTREAQSVHSP